MISSGTEPGAVSVFALFALLAALGATGCDAPGRSRSLAFRDVRVFDGERTIERATVLVEDGHIADVGADLAIPRSARVIEGEGRTLLPGFIDAHAHAHYGSLGPTALAEAQRLLRRSLMFGVTTAISMGGDPAVENAYRAERTDSSSLERADLLVAGWMVTPPGGHGTRGGGPTLSSAEDADAFVRARVDEGSDHIKIVYQLGSSDQRPPNAMPMLEEPVMRAAVEAAHKYGKTVAVHVNSLGAAKDVARAGAEVLAHLFFDQVADDEVIRLLLEHGMYVTPTFTPHEQIFHESEWREADDPRVAPYLGPGEVAILRASGGQERPQWTNMIESVRVLHAAGVPLLAGVDNIHLGGPLMHRELETLVSAGLGATDALIAATSAPANAFGLEDRGRIVPGARADLLLVRGDPTIDITVTRDIVGVWKAGVEADRAGYAAEQRAMTRRLESEDELVIADFEEGDGAPLFGSLAEEVTFGSGTAEIQIVDGGAVGSDRALAVSGRLTEADHPFVESPFWYGDYAGVSFSPAPRFMPGVMDFSARSQISFWARGDSAIHRILLFTGARGSTPIAGEFEVGPEWTEITFPFSSFEEADLSTLRQIFLAAGPGAGDFRFEIDEIRIR